jgi:GNAT superfamily N-acetyltransferase
MPLLIRDFDPALDRAAALAFIDGSQAYGLMQQVEKKRGRVFLAEEDGRAVGWAVFVVEQNAIFVVEAERTFGYVSELFVAEEARSRGIGRALIEACETHARALGLGLILIGVLAKNERTARIYARAGYAPYAVEMRKYL